MCTGPNPEITDRQRHFRLERSYSPTGFAGAFKTSEGLTIRRLSDIPNRALRSLRSPRGAGNTRARSCGDAHSRKAGNTGTGCSCRVIAWVQSFSAQVRARGPCAERTIKNWFSAGKPYPSLIPYPLPLIPLFSATAWVQSFSAQVRARGPCAERTIKNWFSAGKPYPSRNPQSAIPNPSFIYK